MSKTLQTMKRRMWLLLIVLLVAVSLGTLASAGEAAPTRKLLVVVIDDVTWRDLAGPRLPVLRGLAADSAVGLMCVQTAGGERGAYLTMGVGACAAAGETREGLAFNANEKGKGASEPIVHFALPELRKENRFKHRPVALGLLGGTLGPRGRSRGVPGKRGYG